MAGSLEILRKGLTALQKHVKKRKTAIEARLTKKERVDDDDAAWLDGPANLIDEQQALDSLENASDYERGLSRLSQGLQAACGRQIQLEAMNAAVETSITDFFQRNE
ncbi:hypothetical protein GGX14DRAFT_575896 [Mycena pura]|uniref:Uncharacterized protein n=1 Tax=Mycena pura TaxID=153505 RepID=A0AAD6Y1U8_9AGAR|nr:hypothetical protein GGX14DRAFT_575896 [Mycena pura]